MQRFSTLGMFRALSSLALAMGGPAFAEAAVAEDAKADQAHAQKQLEGLSAVLAFVAPGPAFDPRKAMAGKSILSIPGPSNDPWYEHVLDGMSAKASRGPATRSPTRRCASSTGRAR